MWAPNGTAFTVGHMGRQVDLFTLTPPSGTGSTGAANSSKNSKGSGGSGKMLKGPPGTTLVSVGDVNRLTAIPGVSIFHSQTPQLITGNASGYVCLWA